MVVGLNAFLYMICLNQTVCDINDNININNSTNSTDNKSLFISDGTNQKASEFLKAVILDKLRQELKGQTLRVTTIEDYPLSYTTENKDGKKVGKGVAFDILHFLEEKFHFDYELVPPERNIVGSSWDMEGSLMATLNESKADIAAAFIPILADARKHMLFSTSLDEGEWMIVMIRPRESASGSGLMAPFDQNVWMLVLVSLLAVGPIIYLLIIIRYKLTKDKEQIRYSLPYCVWFVYGALMKQGSTLSPTADSTRVLFATWWIFITILTSFYTANLTAFLTLSKFTLPINNWEDILKKEKHFVTRRGNGIEYAIRNSDEALTQLQALVDKKLADFSGELNDTDILMRSVEKKDYVFIRDKPAVDHLVYKDYKYRKQIDQFNEKIHCPFAVAKTPFLKRKRAFAYPLKTKWNALFDPELLNLVESGIIKYKLKEGLPNAEICPQNLIGTERQLRNGDLVTTYLVMLTGFSTASVVFLTELFFRYLNQRNMQKNKIADSQNPRLANGLDQPMKLMRKQVSPPPPPYTTLYSRYNETKPTKNSYKNGVRQVINGRDYMVVKELDGSSKLIPMRSPSAALFQYTYTE